MKKLVLAVILAIFAVLGSTRWISGTEKAHQKELQSMLDFSFERAHIRKCRAETKLILDTNPKFENYTADEKFTLLNLQCGR
jgi:hypothetical protein